MNGNTEIMWKPGFQLCNASDKRNISLFLWIVCLIEFCKKENKISLSIFGNKFFIY